MLQVEHLSKSYGNLNVVRDVSLNVSKGELVAITGASGAGKSTLLHLIGGLDLADSGRVLLEGLDLLNLPRRKQAQFRNQKIGFVFQFHHLLPEFTAVENVAIPLWIAKQSKQNGLKQAAELLELVGLAHRLDHKPAALSGGEQQRVAIARALVNRPSIVLADEPTGNLDSNNAQSIHQLFVQLSQDLHQTFVLVTHNQELAEMTHRNLVMRDGQIVREILNKQSAP